MNYTLRQLAAFQAILSHRNITRAAQELGMTQSGLSALLRELEAEAGVPLFERTTRRVNPTSAGEAFAPLAERVLTEARGMAEDFAQYRKGARGRVRLGVLPSLAAMVLPDLVGRFQSEHPNVELDIVEGHAGALFQQVRDGSLHMALGTAFAQAPHLKRDHLWQDEVVAALPASAHAPDGPALRWRDLAALDFIAISQTASLRTLSDAGFQVAGVTPRSQREVGSMATAVAFVRAGLGATILPSSALSMFRTDGVVMRALSEPQLVRDIWLIAPRRSPSPAEAAFRAAILHLVEGLQGSARGAVLG